MDHSTLNLRPADLAGSEHMRIACIVLRLVYNNSRPVHDGPENPIPYGKYGKYSIMGIQIPYGKYGKYAYRGSSPIL